MSFLKNIILLVVFASLIYFGGAGTQSDSTSLQGMGFVSVVIGLIVLYILFKIFWSAMSMSMALIVIGGVVWFILYSLGMLGSDSVTKKLGDKFFSANEPSVEYAEDQQQNGQMADVEPKVIFGGRLGEYKYYDMDQVIATALDRCEKEF